MNDKLLEYGIEMEEEDQNELFDNLSIGDMVWALMPLKQKALNLIERQHHIRPYLIMAKQEDVLIGYYCSSAKRDFLKMGEYHELNTIRNPTNRESYVDLRKMVHIPKSNLISFMYSISELDRIDMDHKIMILKNRSRGYRITFQTPFVYRIGDVVALKNEDRSNNKTYYIYKIENDTYYVIPLTVVHRQKTSIKNLIIDGVKFSFKFKDRFIVHKEDIQYAVYMFDRKYFGMIERRLKEFIRLDKKNKKSGLTCNLLM